MIWAKLLVKKGLKSRLTELDAKVKPMLARKVQEVLINLQLHDKFTDLHYTFLVEEKVQAVVLSLEPAPLRSSLADFVQAKAVLREDLNELGLLDAFEKGRGQLSVAIGRFMRALEDKLKESKSIAAPHYDKLKSVLPITGTAWKSSDHAALVKKIEQDQNVVQSLRDCCLIQLLKT